MERCLLKVQLWWSQYLGILRFWEWLAWSSMSDDNKVGIQGRNIPAMCFSSSYSVAEFRLIRWTCFAMAAIFIHRAWYIHGEFFVADVWLGEAELHCGSMRCLSNMYGDVGKSQRWARRFECAGTESGLSTACLKSHSHVIACSSLLSSMYSPFL